MTRPFGLDDILKGADSSPEDFGDWNRHWEKVQATVLKAERDGGLVPEEGAFKYKGPQRYVLIAGSVKWVIIAKERRNGTFEILDVRQFPHET